MRAGWKTITLNEACIQMNGIWKGTKEPLVPAKVLRTTNFSKDCRIKLDDLAIIDVEKKKLDARRLQRGDIIVEKSGGGPKQPVGRVILFDMDDDDYSFCNFTSALRIKDKEQLDYNYLHKYLIYLYFEGKTEKYQSNLVGFRNLDFKGYVGIEVPYPSLPEQQHIVAILDREFAKIDALKANAEKSANGAKDLFLSVLEGVFSNKAYPLSSVSSLSKITSGFAFKSSDFVPYGDYQVIRLGNVKQNNLRLDASPVFINRPDDKVISKSKLEIGDLLITQTGTKHKMDYGFVAMVDADNLLLNQRVARLRFPDLILARWFLYYSYTQQYKSQFFAHEGGTVGQGNVGISALTGMMLPIPDNRTIAEKVKELDGLFDSSNIIQQNYQKTLTLCDDLKQALLRKAFNGEL